MSWTEEMVELLTKLLQEGWSASQVAAEMGGISRNAVIGKIHRLGLTGRGQPAAAKRQRKPRPLAEDARMVRPCALGNAALRAEVRTVPQPVARMRENVVVPISKRLPIEKLTEHTCKWPIGDPGHSDFHFCGHEARSGLPYCDYHARLAYHCADPGKRARKAAVA